MAKRKIPQSTDWNEWIRNYCLSLPSVTEDIQWENDLLFRIGGKIFTGVSLDPASPGLSFKCTPEEFSELILQDGIIPAPYVARYHWVSIRRPNVLPGDEIKRLIKDSYDMVRAKLPKSVSSRLK